MEKWEEEFRQLASKIEHAIDRRRLKLKQKLKLLDDITIQAYRGYGNQEKMYIKGRVLEKEGLEIPEEDSNLWDNLKTLYYRYESDEIPQAPLAYKLGDVSGELKTDEEGYFEATLQNPGKLSGWQTLTYRLLQQYKENQPEIQMKGEVLLQSPNSSFGLISDLDDTVIVSQATNFFEKSRILLLNNERSRKPFEGVAAFYRALRGGHDQGRDNPVFYVSSSSWNLYDMFENFCDFNEMPKGVFLLRDVGLDKSKFYRSSHNEHKVTTIAQVLQIFQNLPFVLIGDSGQHDPEIYQQLVAQFPGRIKAVYIRDVDPQQNKARDNEVNAIAQQVQQLGVPMLLVKNSLEAAKHAIALGLIPEAALADVQKDVEEDEQQQHDMHSMLGLHRVFNHK